MKTKQGNMMGINQVRLPLALKCLAVFLLLQAVMVKAADLSLANLDVANLSGDRMQIQLEMSGQAISPRVFQTDNPARIALDFPGVTNGLSKKMFPINQGAVSSVYVAEAADRVRVVVNLIETTRFDTKVEGNKVILSILGSAPVAANPQFRPAILPKPGSSQPYIRKSTPSSVAAGLMPQQVIRGIDFKRGDNGEGRILVSLTNPDTVVNTKEEGGNLVLSFINTRLPENLSKRLDVSEFGTPVKTLNTTASSREATMTVGMQNSLYDYSLFQSEGLLTVEFRPLTAEEKEVLDSKRDKYKGDRLSLNFQDIDIRSVIAILAEFTGQNMVAGDEVAGTITLKMDDVPWDEALDFIMMTKGLEKFEYGNVILIAPVGKIKEYKEKQEATEKVVEQLEPLVTEYIKINYARAENFRNLLNGMDTGAFGSCGANKSAGGSGSSGGGGGGGAGGSTYPGATLSTQGAFGGGQGGNSQGDNANQQNDKFRILSARGSAVVDARTNTLIVRETAKRLEDAKKLIRRLDVPVRQVMIEVRIVTATNKFLKDLGVRFGAAKTADIGSGTQFGLGGGGIRANQGTGSTTITTNANGTQTATGTGTPATIFLPKADTSAAGDLSRNLVDLGLAGNPYGALAMTLARTADYVLNLELQALQDQNMGELLSNPKVMTQDRCEATIKQGTQIPYRVAQPGGNAYTVEFKDATLTLNVLPQITPSGSVVMALRVNKDAPLGSTTDGVPIDTRQLETNVHVMDGETVVLGGVFEDIIENNVNKVPFFGDLPGVGFLFKRTHKLDDKKELLIFVTPKIVKDNFTASN